MKKKANKTLFKCSICHKLTSGRIPKNGDTTFRYPRRHKINGKDCPGNIKEAEWINEHD